jgi:hypothetical protein
LERVNGVGSMMDVRPTIESIVRDRIAEFLGVRQTAVWHRPPACVELGTKFPACQSGNTGPEAPGGLCHPDPALI